MHEPSFRTLKSAIETFCEKNGDHPLLKDSIGTLKAALYEIEPTFLSPGQKVARSYTATGQEDQKKAPQHQ